MKRLQKDIAIPTSFADKLEEAVKRFPSPRYLSDGRKNKFLAVYKRDFEEILTRIKSGQRVGLEELCRFKENFVQKRSPFYDDGKCEKIDAIIDTLRMELEALLLVDTPLLLAKTSVSIADPLPDVVESPPVSLDGDPKIEINFGGKSDYIICADPKMRELFELAEILAREGDTSVLLLGETGVGKDLMAKFLHSKSPRSGQPFVALNCAAIPHGLIESELFGHAKGAFTGATRDHQGLLEKTQEGTLFLDEIGDMPMPLQAKLLRVLQDGSYRPVGGNNGEKKFGGKVITATNTDLPKAVDSGKFRADLFYRINQFPLKIPPLSERSKDIPPLVNYLMDKARGGYKIDAKALEKLMEHKFPGNVRELEGILKRARIFSLMRAGRKETDPKVITEVDITCALSAV